MGEPLCRVLFNMFKTHVLTGDDITSRIGTKFAAMQCNPLRGPPLDSQGGGEGAGVVVAGKLFISTGLGGALKISHFLLHVYMEQLLK